MDYYDLKSNAWINGKSGSLPETGFLISGLRLSVLFTDQSLLKIMDRIPYATSF